MIKSTKTKDELFTEQLEKTLSMVRMTNDLMDPQEFHELWLRNADKIGLPKGLNIEDKEVWVCFYYHYICLELMESTVKEKLLKERPGPGRPNLRIVK